MVVRPIRTFCWVYQQGTILLVGFQGFWKTMIFPYRRCYTAIFDKRCPLATASSLRRHRILQWFNTGLNFERANTRSGPIVILPHEQVGLFRPVCAWMGAFSLSSYDSLYFLGRRVEGNFRLKQFFLLHLLSEWCSLFVLLSHRKLAARASFSTDYLLRYRLALRNIIAYQRWDNPTWLFVINIIGVFWFQKESA